MSRVPRERAIARWKIWCDLNYNRGADTMVECWEQAEWDAFWSEHRYYTRGLAILKRIAAVHADRQADARHYEENA